MVSSPNSCTISRAVAAPTPRIRPDARYRSMPSKVEGASTSQLAALNCLPYCGCCTHSPWNTACSPAATSGITPTTVTFSRPARTVSTV